MGSLVMESLAGEFNHGIRGIHGTYNGGGGSRGGAEGAEACRTDGGNLLGKNASANFHHGLPFLCCCSAFSAPLREILLPWMGEALAEARRAQRLAGRMVVICLARMPAQISNMGCHW